MGRRFNNLDAALKLLRPTGADEGSPVPDAPAGTALRKYQDFKAEKVNIEYPRAAASLPGQLLYRGLKPFGYPAADTNIVRVPFSERASSGLGTVGLSEAALGLTAPAEGDIDLTGFRPAKAIARNFTGTTSVTKTSQITGLRYKTKANNSYTFPLGRTTGSPSYSEQKSAIIALVEATATRGVSFQPERF